MLSGWYLYSCSSWSGAALCSHLSLAVVLLPGFLCVALVLLPRGCQLLLGPASWTWGWACEFSVPFLWPCPPNLFSFHPPQTAAFWGCQRTPSTPPRLWLSVSTPPATSWGSAFAAGNNVACGIAGLAQWGLLQWHGLSSRVGHSSDTWTFCLSSFLSLIPAHFWLFPET